jgi:predicted nucleic acid-binding Zn ribbon protein
MPIYRYICSVCRAEAKAMVLASQRKNHSMTCEKCGTPMARTIGVPDCIPMETTDAYRGKSRFMGTNEKRKKRADDHFKRVEMKKIIDKEGVEFAKRHGWIDDEKKSR